MAGESPDYLMFVRCQPCRMWMNDPCEGKVEAHHAGRDRGLSQRAHDSTAIPLCHKHHRNWHDASGPFRHFKKRDRRAWADRQVAWTRAQWTAEGEEPLW